MTIQGICPTPKKSRYYDLSLAESILIRIKHRTEANLEVYECVDHWHIRDKTKRKRLDHKREKYNRQQRKKYQQLTIFDWMNEINGT